MEEQTVCVDLYQRLGDEVAKFYTPLDRKTLDKMGEILKRDPEGTWKERDLDLACQAAQELEAEKAQKQPQSEEQPSEPLSTSQPKSEGLEQ